MKLGDKSFSQYPHVQTGYTNITRWLYARWCYMVIVCAHTL